MLLPCLLSHCAALLSAGLLARQRPSHRPVFWLLFASFAASVVSVLLALAVPAIIRPADPALPPLEGWVRVSFHIYTAAQLVWPIGLAGAALALFAGDRGWTLALAAWAVLVIDAIIFYSHGLRGEELRVFMLGVHLVSLLLVAASVASHYHRRAPINQAHHCLLLCALTELAVTVAGPWRLGLWGQWPLALLGYTLLFLSLTAYQGALTWSRNRRTQITRC